MYYLIQSYHPMNRCTGYYDMIRDILKQVGKSIEIISP